MFELLSDIFRAAWKRKKIWLLPLVLGLITIGGIVIITQGTAVAPFIYTLF